MSTERSTTLYAQLPIGEKYKMKVHLKNLKICTVPALAYIPKSDSFLWLLVFAYSSGRIELNCWLLIIGSCLITELTTPPPRPSTVTYNSRNWRGVKAPGCIVVMGLSARSRCSNAGKRSNALKVLILDTSNENFTLSREYKQQSWFQRSDCGTNSSRDGEKAPRKFSG